MLFFSIHVLDTSLLAIANFRNLLRNGHSLEEKLNPNKTEEATTETIDTIGEAYLYAALGIWIHLSLTAFYAAFAKFLDLLLGPLQWKHVTIFYAAIMASVTITKQKPAILVIMFAVLSIMPGFISGSLTKIMGALFCLGTVLWPLVVHTWENISDRTEVRQVLLGLLLDLIYLGTSKLIKHANGFELKSIGLIFLVPVAECALFYGGIVLMYQDGPWNRVFRMISPLSSLLKSFVRYAVQLLLFYSNRFVRRIFVGTFTTKLPRIGTRAYNVNSREMAQDPVYNTNFPNHLMGAEDTYVYDALTDQASIRLLIIRKGWPSQKLQCNFEVVQLGFPKEYEAVSYVWGCPDTTCSIMVDGKRLAITQSAFDIIHRRRSALLDQLVWIDQICINQVDTEEKASQVQIMGQIYKEASRVIAYLGTSEDAHLVQLLFADLHFMKQGLGLPPGVFKVLGLVQRAKWDALVKFFSSPWFQRVWIVSVSSCNRICPENDVRTRKSLFLLSSSNLDYS